MTGRQEFWGLELEVSPAVLIPRPETELLVETALARLALGRVVDAIDVGTGSGCIAIAIASERPLVRMTAADISADALAVTRRNAIGHGVSGRIEFVKADLLNGIDRPFDLIVSNPPYVSEPDRSTLQPEVRDYEPAQALFAGKDGLAVIRRLVEQSASRLKPEGLLIFELGAGQADAVRTLLAAVPGLALLDVAADLQGYPRVAIVVRR